MNIDLEYELGSEIEALLREDYEELEGIEEIDELLEEVLSDFHVDLLSIAENYFRFSIPNLTKERVNQFVSNHEPEEEDDEDVE
tara:strand:- start:21473 stop:21724 length:252 start_codon:yes stop_codon:yes gene_type:complete